MNKIRMFLVIIIGSLMSPIVFAKQDTTIWTCPSNITCDYDTGVCNNPSQWNLVTNGALEPFSGSKTINLSSILGNINGSAPTQYAQLTCYYAYGNSSFIALITTYPTSLTGVNWVYSGWGNDKATCSNVSDPTTCEATQ